MRDPVPLFLARDPVELAAAQDLLTQAAIAHSVRAPFASIESLMGGSEAPALIHVDSTDLERARAVLAEAWGAAPPLPEG